MQYFDLVLSFTALFGLCAFLTLKARLHSALAPLAALGITGPISEYHDKARFQVLLESLRRTTDKLSRSLFFYYG